MREWLTFGVVAAIVIIAALIIVNAALKIWRIVRRMGSFECSYRPEGGTWQRGIGVFDESKLVWNHLRLMGVAGVKTLSWQRKQLEILEHSRRPAASGSPRFLNVSLRDPSGSVIELSMHESAFFGLVSWLESATHIEGPEI